MASGAKGPGKKPFFAGEARTQGFLKPLPDAMLILDNTGTVLDFSASDRLDLFPVDGIVAGRTIQEVLPAEVVAGIAQGMQEAAHSAEPSTIKLSVPKTGGEYEVRLMSLDGNKTLAIVRDVSSRRRAELEMARSERFFEQIARTLPGVLFVYDLIERRNIYVNQGGWGLLGYSDQEFMEMGDAFISHVMHPDDQAALPKLTQQYASAPEGQLFENVFRMRHKNGNWRWIHRYATIFTRTPDGRPHELIGTAVDITPLKETEKELHELSGRLLHAQHQERRRIARELHDGTAQNLFAISLNLKQLEQPVIDSATRRILSECQKLCDASLQEIRTLSYLLHPPMLDQEGLVPTVRWFVKGFEKRSGLNVKLEIHGDAERLPRPLERDLFLVLQEALSNVVRHSGCKTAVIRLQIEGARVTLQIEDAGRGMADSPSHGVGIPSMRERLRLLGGELGIQSSNHGTTVTATAPIRPESVDSSD